MVRELLELTDPQPGETAADLTVGTAGHSIALSQRLGPEGFLLGLDRDPRALRIAEERLSRNAPCKFRLLCFRFSRFREAAAQAGITAFDLALADLGVGTHQLMDMARGFSLDSDGRLDMRFDASQRTDAWEVVNNASQQQLADIVYQFGEERYSRQIADRVCRQRREHSIDTPRQLAELIKKVVARRGPRRRWRIHPATRSMMALRIYVNEELQELEALLDILPQMLNRGGRAAILTFQSLEARRVKHTWRAQQKANLIEIVTRKAVKPSADEINRNPRARSAQMRVARKL